MTLRFPDDKRRRAVESIKRFFAETLDDDVGELKAALLLDYFLEELAPVVYNQAIGDAQAYFQDRVADLEGACHRPEFGYWKR